jgi:transcription-repair coupling factor (superfamily II helicase)
MRAIYRAVVNGRQAALLAPTGVLAAQHYKNIVKRMGPDTPFNITVTLLRGGMSPTTKAGRAIRSNIKDGASQLVVGTHALLSKEVTFKDLGLLVVDEEQRFGVKQKERLKLICSGVDVLTLSATPIPRTLQMSLSGIRDTSTIRSPPPMRKPTVTYVQDFSEEMVEDAIRRELARGGQCYYVVPRIALIEEAQEMVQRLFPDIRVIQAHGRMPGNGAEDNVAAFAEGDYDILLATTVIENGVDIPTVNTIIVQDSHFFGMSTLYQLRGRVGRSDRQAYAYFLHRDDAVTEQAAMRLQAIGELSELGSGFDVANRDLEIRGAGSLLGTEQSGMAARVGFDLYMRMLKKSIRQLRGLDLPLVPRTNILIPTDGTPSTFTLLSEFVPDGAIRHREESKARLAESTAKLVNLTNAWKQDYGDLPASLQNQLKTLHLHACTRRLGIDLVGLVDAGDGTMDCVLRSPGLRPRHWGMILPHLPRKTAPKGLDVCFPARFTLSGEEEEIIGGKKIDLLQLLSDDSEDGDDEQWDAIDEEEVEAMKQITSAVNVKSMDEVDLEQYPRFVVRDFGSNKGTDRLLKLLLPIAKTVYERQEDQAEQAMAAAELREKQALLRSRKKSNEELNSQRQGYRYQS